jgi:hypothetical protein
MCTGVGFYQGNTGIVSSLIVQTTDGTTWTRLPSPSHGRVTELTDVTCTSATECVAVGGYQTTSVTGNPKFATLVVRTTDGTSWDEVASPSRNQSSVLWGVSCVSATRCRAVGQLDDKSLVLRTSDGITWFRQPAPQREGGANFLVSLDCVTNTNCTAVGGFQNFLDPNAHAKTLVLRTTDGRNWSLVPSPNPSPGTSASTLDDVSCTGPTTCVAVGSLAPIPGGVNRALILRTANGTTWTRSPTPTSAGEVDLGGVDCLAATDCTAAGFQWNAAHTIFRASILRTTDGISWAPISDRIGHAIDDVSCAVAAQCVGVGMFNTTGDPDASFRSLVLHET